MDCQPLGFREGNQGKIMGAFERRGRIVPFSAEGEMAEEIVHFSLNGQGVGRPGGLGISSQSVYSWDG